MANAVAVENCFEFAYTCLEKQKASAVQVFQKLLN